MIGQISASNQLRTSSELAPNMFGASSELASVMEFGFNATDLHHLTFTQYAVLPHNIEITLWPQITMTSLHPMYYYSKFLSSERTQYLIV